MEIDKLPAVVEYLLHPSSYPHTVGEVRLVQTHISYVLLAGDFVYKLKKPVKFAFLDFSNLSQRKYFCEQELILNRRLCPTIYLGLVSINRAADGTLQMDGDGEPVEYGVKMVRMPEERMMGNIIRRGQLTGQLIDGIVETLGPFYAQAASGPDIEKFGTVDAVRANVMENLTQNRQYIGCESLSREEYDHIEKYVSDCLADQEVFRRRLAAGRIKDCHGDLHSGNICLADQVYIYDCIEFNHRFRYSDVASDIAFLAMDLDYYGLHELSDYFVHSFQSVSGDETLPEVLNFYKCYRATVRGKIGLLTAHEPEVDDRTRDQALAQATRYFFLAQKYADLG
jgi:aminoglycoside phosphotransferase family enzyme